MGGIARPPSSPIRTTPDGGYLATAEPGHVDLRRFRDLLDKARRSESAESELATPRAALARWRSRPFGNHRHAISACLRAIARELADTHMSAVIRHQVGNAYLALGEIRHAITAFRRAIGGFRELGIRRWEAFVLVDLGQAVRAAGHPCIAKAILAAAVRTLTRIADPRCAEIAAIIDDVGGYPSSAASGM